MDVAWSTDGKCKLNFSRNPQTKTHLGRNRLDECTYRMHFLVIIVIISIKSFKVCSLWCTLKFQKSSSRHVTEYRKILMNFENSGRPKRSLIHIVFRRPGD